ncbi:MAG: hypothetical protein ABFS19_12730, partial [Thermodesulfobacteriota bacterium]
MRSFFIFLLVYLLSSSTACTRERYLDAPAPSGNRVPPPSASVPQTQVQEIPRYDAKLPDRGGYAKSKNKTLDGMILPDSDGKQLTGVGGADEGRIGADFQRQYQKAGSPRIAVFLNRSLSAEVRQWRTSSRTVVSGDGEIGSTSQGLMTSTTTKATGNVSVSNQAYIEEEKRRAPSEGYLWAYENGFMKPFLKTGTYLLDRATIMRINALDNGQGNAYDPISVKRIEMKTLLDKADIFIELLITRNSGSPYGYEFKATAKEVRTGRILANSTSLDWDWESAEGHGAIVGKDGYEVVDVVVVPPMKEVSTALAVNLMKDLTTV